MELAEDITKLMNVEAIKKLPFQKKRAIIDFIEETIEEGEEHYDENDTANYAYETPEELAILEERLQEYLSNPDDVITLEELKREFLTDGRG